MITGTSTRFLGREHHGDLPAFHFWPLFNRRQLAQVLLDTIKQNTGNLLVRHFAPTKPQRNLDLIAFFKKAQYAAHLDLVVMVFRAGTKFYFLDFDLLLLFAGLSQFLALLKLELAIIHDLADRGIGIGRDFDQVQFCFGSTIKRIAGSNDTGLFTIFIDESNFTCRDFVIDTRLVWITVGRRVLSTELSYLLILLRLNKDGGEIFCTASLKTIGHALVFRSRMLIRIAA